MRKIMRTNAGRTAAVVGVIMLAMSFVVGHLWPLMLALWAVWAIVTVLSVRSEVRRGRAA